MNIITESKSILENTVSAENQVSSEESVKIVGNLQRKLKILFLGNSITWVPKHIEIGWMNDCGMAASEPSKDYLHLLMKKVFEIEPDTDYCIAQMAAWERAYWDDNYLPEHYAAAKSYEADIIIVRIVENVPKEELANHSFYDAYKKMLDFFDPNHKKKIILTTSFWYAGERDLAIEKIAKERKLPLVELGDLGDNPEMKAIGSFTHTGVSAHPGDKGMQEISDRIWKELSKIIKER